MRYRIIDISRANRNTAPENRIIPEFERSAPPKRYFTELNQMENSHVTNRLKKKETRIETFLFPYKRPHTKFITEQEINSIYTTAMLPDSGVVSIKLSSKIIFLNQLLEDFTESDARRNLRLILRQIRFKKENQQQQRRRRRLEQKSDKVALTNKILHYVLELLDNGYALQYVSDLTGFTTSQLKYYRKKKRNNQLPLITDKNKIHKITKVHLDALKQFMQKSENSVTTLHQLRNTLLESFPTDFNKLSLETVRRMLRRIKYSRKRLQNRAIEHDSQSNVEKRKSIVIEFLKNINRDI